MNATYKPIGLKRQMFGPLTHTRDRIFVEVMIHYSSLDHLIRYLNLWPEHRAMIEPRLTLIWAETVGLVSYRDPKRLRKRARALQHRMAHIADVAFDIASQETLMMLEIQYGPREKWATQGEQFLANFRRRDQRVALYGIRGGRG